MEQERINIAPLLKDCPKGTKLYSPLFGECELYSIDEKDTYFIAVVNDLIGYPERFDKFGRYYHVFKDSECLLFPSKEVRDWSTFRVPQKEEKQKSKFKVGDVVKYDDGTMQCVVENLERKGKLDNCGKYITTIQGNPLLTNPLLKRSTLATEEEIAKWNEETLHPNRLHYSKSKRKIIHWFLVKDEVLVKDDNYDTPWNYCIFSHYTNKEYPYFASGAEWKHCLPYKGQTARLIGTTKDYKEE